MDLAEFGRTLGLGGVGWNSPVVRTLRRMTLFDLATFPGDATLAIRRRVPPLAARELQRLSPPLQRIHTAMLARHDAAGRARWPVEIAGSTGRALRGRGCGPPPLPFANERFFPGREAVPRPGAPPVKGGSVPPSRRSLRYSPSFGKPLTAHPGVVGRGQAEHGARRIGEPHMNLPAEDFPREMLVVLTQGDITMPQLADSLGVHPRWLGRVLAGEITELPLLTVVGLCRRLRIMPEDILDPGLATQAFADSAPDTFDADEEA